MIQKNESSHSIRTILNIHSDPIRARRRSPNMEFRQSSSKEDENDGKNRNSNSLDSYNTELVFPRNWINIKENAYDSQIIRKQSRDIDQMHISSHFGETTGLEIRRETVQSADEVKDSLVRNEEGHGNSIEIKDILQKHNVCCNNSEVISIPENLVGGFLEANESSHGSQSIVANSEYWSTSFNASTSKPSIIAHHSKSDNTINPHDHPKLSFQSIPPQSNVPTSRYDMSKHDLQFLRSDSDLNKSGNLTRNKFQAYGSESDRPRPDELSSHGFVFNFSKSDRPNSGPTLSRLSFISNRPDSDISTSGEFTINDQCSDPDTAKQLKTFRNKQKIPAKPTQFEHQEIANSSKNREKDLEIQHNESLINTSKDGPSANWEHVVEESTPNTFRVPIANEVSDLLSQKKGDVTVTLLNSSLWKAFHKIGTEMIINRGGRSVGA